MKGSVIKAGRRESICLEASGHVTKQRVNKEQADLTATMVHSTTSVCRIGGKSCLHMVSFLLRSLYSHFPPGWPLLPKVVPITSGDHQVQEQ